MCISNMFLDGAILVWELHFENHGEWPLSTQLVQLESGVWDGEIQDISSVKCECPHALTKSRVQLYVWCWGKAVQQINEAVVGDVKCELEIEIGTCDRVTGGVAALDTG